MLYNKNTKLICSVVGSRVTQQFIPYLLCSLIVRQSMYT